MFRSVTLMSLSMLLIALTNAPPMAGAAIVLNEDFDSGGLNVPLCIINTSNPSRPAITLAGRYNWPEDPSQWAWMMFSMTGANATTPQFTVLASNIGGGVYYPASWTRYVYSYDQQNWFFFDNGSLNSGSLIYSFSNNSAFNQNTVYVALGIPYPCWRTAAFVASIKSNPYVKPTASADANCIVGNTPGTYGHDANGNLYYDDMGRVVPSMPVFGFMINDANATGPKTRVVMQSGNHGAEHWAHYALEGMVQALLSNDPNMVALRQKAIFFIYPDVNPEGNYCGYWRSTPVNPGNLPGLTADHNRLWADPNGLAVGFGGPTRNPEIAIVENAQRADAGSAEYFLDVHGTWDPTSGPDYLNLTSYNSALANNLRLIDPGDIGAETYWGDLRFAMGYASAPVSTGGLAAVTSLTPEIGMKAGETADYNRQLGKYYMMALYATLNAPGNNFPPTVSAGANQTIHLPTNTASLAGTVSDDGLPTGSAVTVTWSKVSGPGTVTFANASAAATRATFSTSGTYILRLTATDTALPTFAQMQVTVASGNAPPVVNAGANQSITLPINTVNLVGTVSDDGLPTGAAVTTTWSRLGGPGSVTFANPSALSTTATFSTAGTYVLQLAASDTALTGTSNLQVTVIPANQAPVVNAGANQAITLPVNTVALAGTVSDDGLPTGAAVTTTWSRLSGPGNVTFANTSALSTAATFSTAGTYLLQLAASDTALTGTSNIQVTVAPGVNQAPVVSAGANQGITLPINTVALTGTVSDDGLPFGAAVTTTWSRLGGPGSVTFTNASALSTTATFSTAGTYMLQLAASDTALTGTSNMQVTVAPPGNQAPVVSAGANQTITLPANTVALAGTVSDDGLPTPPGAVTLAWTLQSGPGTVSFANAAAAATTATFSTAGTYVLRLTASDTALTSYGQCTVVVQPPASPSHAERILIDVGDPTTGSGTGWNNFTVHPHWSGTPGVDQDGYDVYLQELAPGAVVDSNNANLPGVAFGVSNLDDVRTNSGTANSYTVDGLTYPLTATEDIAQSVDATQGDINGPTTGYMARLIISGLTGSSYNVRLLSARDSGGTRLGYFRINGGAIQSVDSGNAPALLTFPKCAPAAITCGQTNLSNAIEVEFWGTVGGTVDLNLIDMVAVPSNTPPTVTASAVYPKVMIPNGLSLSGTVSDDGLPAGSTVTVAWSEVSGPGNVTFANPTATSTMATFSSAGTYVLQLAASDTDKTGTGNVTVTVLAPADFNGDGKVDGVDFLIWQSHYPTASGGKPESGDANGDGKVDGVDFLIWQSHYTG